MKFNIIEPDLASITRVIAGKAKKQLDGNFIVCYYLDLRCWIIFILVSECAAKVLPGYLLEIYTV